MFQLGLIGYPIKHSLSPWIHEQFLQKANLRGNYSIMEINRDDSFTEKIDKIKNHEINGFNVTVPYKQKIISYLDELDVSAEKIGAVNTVLHQNGKWIGYNTDGVGYVRSLERSFPDLFLQKSNRMLILGAGGAARGIYYALVVEGFKYIDIANRTAKSAMEIASLGNESTQTSILTLTEAEQCIETYDVIIQTTSVGMKPEIDQSIISLEKVKKTSIVSDIVYQPLKTKFLSEAESLGAAIHYGHTMLLYQAQYAFEIWTNKRVEVDNMDEELKHILEGR